MPYRYGNQRYKRNRYNNYNKGNRGNNRGNQGQNRQGRQFRGIMDLKPPTPQSTQASTEQSFIKSSLTVGQLDFIMTVFSFIKNKSFIKAEQVGITQEGLDLSHAFLTILYNQKAGNNAIPNKEQWKAFYSWLATFNGSQQANNQQVGGQQ